MSTPTPCSVIFILQHSAYFVLKMQNIKLMRHISSHHYKIYSKRPICAVLQIILSAKKFVKTDEPEFNYSYIYSLIISKAVFFLNKKPT